MTIHYQGHGVALHHGDCLDVLRTLPDASVDSVVTDPPYNLSFMAKPWDAFEGREDAGFAYWLSGLIDGEGHFAIKAHSRGTHAPYFALKMRADERGTLDRIRRSLGVGVVSLEAKEPNPMAKYVIQDKAGCQRLVDLLDKYPLRAKKQLDYWTWREAVCEWTSRPRGNRWHGGTDNGHMAELRSRLMETRAYADVPWSGHEFQDWCRLWATECLRVLKPGGHAIAFGGTRTFHRLAAGFEDAGFEVRDSIAWMYGSGFPKSLDVSKAIDKRRHDGADIRRVTAWVAATRTAAGVTNRDIDAAFGFNGMAGHWTTQGPQAAIPTLDHTPALLAVLGISVEDVPDEIRALLIDLNGMKGQPGPAWFAREITQAEARPLVSGETISFDQRSSKERERRDIPATPDAERWQGWGTALKPAFEPVVVARKPLIGTVAANVLAHGTGALNIDGCRINPGEAVPGGGGFKGGAASRHEGWTRPSHAGGYSTENHNLGRWPTNVALDSTQAAALDEMSGESASRVGKPRGSDAGDGWGMTATGAEYADSGGPSRFFFVAKADSDERPRVNGVAHPTVKPLDLMRWLVRLVTPPGGVVVDPFAGSGTTVEACILEGLHCLAIERESDYLPLIVSRIHRRRDPVEAIKITGDDMGLFAHLEGEGA